MPGNPAAAPLIHFETRPHKPRVFRMTQELIAAAKSRNQAAASTSFGENLSDLSWLGSAAGLVTHNDIVLDPKFPLRELEKAAPRLRWIHITGAGIEPLLPLDWLPLRVTLTNNSGVHAEKIRESAIMMLLMLNARVPAIISNQRKAQWVQIFTPAIKGRTVLVIGVGDMGGAAAQGARMLGLRVIGVRRSGGAYPDVERMFKPDQLDQALPEADFIVMAMPLTPETTGMLNRRRFQLMKRGVGIVNIGRAGSIDHDALAEAMACGIVSGAVLDVYGAEPLPASSPLWKLDNLVMMPHVSSDDEDDYLPKTFDLVFENARRLAAGEPLLNVVDRQRGY